jgi:hypothetical protein
MRKLFMDWVAPGAILATLACFFFYPFWSDGAYMVEWAITVITGVTAWFVAYGASEGLSPKLLPVVALLWLYAVGQAARAKTIAQLPCTTWEKTTCTACLDEEYTQSGPHCVAWEDYECDVCTERTWRSYEWQ